MSQRWIPCFLLLAACATGTSPAEDDAAVLDSAVRMDSAIDGQVIILPDGGTPIDAATPIDGALQADARVIDASVVSGGATAVINEVVPNISGGADLIELKILTGGTLLNCKLHEGPTLTSVGTLIATLPDLTVAAGDIVVVHQKLSSGTAPPGSAPMSESVTKNQYPVGTYSANYDNAWDILGGSTGVTATDVVMTLRASDGTIMDAAVFSNRDGASSATFTNGLAAVQAVNQWLPANCGGAACLDTTTPNAQSLGTNYATVGSTTTGITVQRTGATDTNTAADFTLATSTLGLDN